MAVQSSGSVSITDLATEFGDTAPHSLSEFYGAAAALPASGAISFSDFYGVSNFVAPSSASSGFFSGTSQGSCPTSGQTWTAPAGTTTVYLLLIGGGGGGNSNGNHASSDVFGSYTSGPYQGSGAAGLAVKISGVVENDTLTINPGCGGPNGHDSSNSGGYATTVTGTIDGNSVALSAQGGYGHGDTRHTDTRSANNGSQTTTGATTVIDNGARQNNFGDYRDTYDTIAAFQSAVSSFSTGSDLDNAIAGMLTGVTRNTRNVASAGRDNFIFGTAASASNPLPGYGGDKNVQGANGAVIVYWTNE